MSTTSARITIPGLCKAAPGTICRCGNCTHLVRSASLRLGTSMDAIWAALGWTPTKAAVKAAAPLRSRTLGSVAARAHVIGADGKRVEGPLAVLALVESMGGLT